MTSRAPGFAASAGDKTISFWGRNGVGSNGVTMRVKWRDAANAVIQTDTVSLTSLSNSWQEATKDVIAPNGTAKVWVELVSGTVPGGNSMYIDDVFVGDKPQPDTQAPSAPTQLEATSVAHDKVDLSWAPSTDDVGVAGYRIYRDGSALGTSATTNFSDTTVASSTEYAYTVRAYDAAGNESVDGNRRSVYTPLPPNNHLSADTAGLEASVGEWKSWYSSTIARSTDQSRSGTASLRIDVTKAFGWGVQLKNYPGFAATSGPKTISFWGRVGSASPLGASVRVKWRGADNAVLQTDTVSLPTLTTTWSKARLDVAAPTGTVKAWVEIINTAGAAGVAGDYLYVDEVFVGAAA